MGSDVCKHRFYNSYPLGVYLFPLVTIYFLLHGFSQIAWNTADGNRYDFSFGVFAPETLYLQSAVLTVSFIRRIPSVDDTIRYGLFHIEGKYISIRTPIFIRILIMTKVLQSKPIHSLISFSPGHYLYFLAWL